jgi:phosphopantothenoylcysteine decarboxylase/phosphopantothenate--cysteine ligase
MGYAIARAAEAEGARVLLVSGPVALEAPRNVEIHAVTTADEMYRATHELVAGADIFIAAAAVSDYRPASPAAQKIKKDAETVSLELIRTQDILTSVAMLDSAPFTVGFAAETEDVAAYAKAKLEKKKLDMIVANLVGEDRGFDRDDNSVTVYWPGGEQAFPTAAKSDLAAAIIRLVAARFDTMRGEATRPELAMLPPRKKINP